MIFGSRDLHEAALRHNRETLIGALRTHAIEEVIIEYDGGDDSSSVSDLKIEPDTDDVRQHSITLQHARIFHANDTSHTELVEEACTLEHALDDFTMSWVNLHHPHWEKDAGGRGAVTIDVLKNIFKLEHCTYYMQTIRHVYSL